MSTYYEMIWSAFDSVWGWFKMMYSSYGVDIESFILGALIIAGIIGYILSPYLHNPVPSASKFRSDQERRRMIRDRESRSK